MTSTIEKVRYQNKDYGVLQVQYKDMELPVVLDWAYVKTVKNLDKAWKSNNMGFISCTHTYNGETKDVFLHEIVMAIKQKEDGKKKPNKPILHVNKINLDNRIENLMFDTADKDINKNVKKKSRTIQLPASSGIKPEEIPTYVWYMKPNGSHGDRFMVEIGDVTWKTTSSKAVSMRYKLEEAKLFLRQLKDRRKDLFEEYSMNGDFTKEGKELSDSFYTIVHGAGYSHINRFIPKNNTDSLLKPGTQTRKERTLLSKRGDLVNTDNKDNKEGGKRRLIPNLPKDGPSIGALPKHSYYKKEDPETSTGDHFVVEGHPDQKGRRWQTTSSKTVSLEIKHNELIEYLKSLN